MLGPYGFELNGNCDTCKVRVSNFFCQMEPTTLKAFNAVTYSSVYPEGAVLFLEKTQPRGVSVLCEGAVKLSISSSEGKTLIVRIAKPGEVLGLTAVVGGTPYEVTAETLRPCHVAFIRRDDFLRFVAQHPEVYLSIVKQLTSSYGGACEQLRTVGLSASVPQRLAKLLLDLSQGTSDAKLDRQIILPLTHEEIGECIGSSRESVTRTFSELTNRHLLSRKGSIVTIPDRAALESFANA
jgi:CRP/FNR family transcriptional regulator, cyclic AMP receptor protein